METRRWTNPSQPQTLYMATFLLYINAVFDLVLSFGPITIVLAAIQVAAGFGIANEKRWGYILAVIVAGLAVLLFVIWPLVIDFGVLLNLSYLLNALFPVALFCLLVHPMSREYQKIWFH